MIGDNGDANVPTSKRRPTRAADIADAPATSGAAVPAKASAQVPTLTDAQLSELLDKAQHGDRRAWAALKAGLDAVPHWERMYESPAVYARRALLDASVGDNPVVQEAWARRTNSLTSELIGAGDPTPLERILCERVATCWLDMSLAELTYAERMKERIGLEAGDYYQRMKDRAHARYLSACLALARVRRLLAPVAQQINIAQPGAAQLNVAAPAQPVSASATLPEKTPEIVEADNHTAL